MYILNEENLNLLQRKVAEFSGIESSRIKFAKVKVGEHEGQPIHMSTVMFDLDNFHSKPILVFAHGYAASSVLYFHMYKRLMERFVIICIDHVGMGASSRPLGHFDLKWSPEESLSYFVENLERWRQQFSLDFNFELTNFYMMGHSFGAYVVGNYCVKYHKHVKKLLLLSPLGIRVTPAASEDGLSERDAQTISEMENPAGTGFPLRLQVMLKIVWKQRISPFSVCRVCGEGFMKKIIAEYLEPRIEGDYEKHIIGAYTYQIFMKPGESEYALLINFDEQLRPFLPLGSTNKLASEDFPVPISIVMGD